MSGTLDPDPDPDPDLDPAPRFAKGILTMKHIMASWLKQSMMQALRDYRQAYHQWTEAQP